MLLALLSAALLPMQGQKQGSDYVLHIRHLDTEGTGQVKSYTYYDGLGRPYETVQAGYTPTGKDLVQSNELDASGRVHKAVLPVSRPGSGGETGSTEAETLSSSQHGDSRGYTEYTYDALDRPLSVYGPGEAWHTSDHKQTYTYLTNKPGDALLDARLYESDLGGNLKKSGSYASGELYVTKQEDEEGRTRYEFRDKGGRTVLLRECTEDGNLDTYYVYNGWGLLSHVLPPGASASMGSDGSYGAENAALANYGYTYTYDGYLRLESYRAPGCETEYYVYDKGDRLALSQDGIQRSKGEWSYYAYDGNRLLKAEDAAPAVTDAGVMDFEDGADAPTEYTYDAKGRLTSDKNSGITGITYTLEGYPLVISYGNGNSTEYVYTADGRKLRATYRTVAENVSEPLSSVSQSTAKALVETVRDYAGDAVYENGELVRVLTPEGYVEKSGSGYAHYYYIRDYQGNVRVVADATGAVKEENGYYPFGMLHGGDGGIQPYKYNGKELDRMHGLEWYDYGARMYNGYRFTTPDRYAEKYPSLSPYQYGANNPVNVIDINGDSLKIMSSEAIEAIYHGLEDKNVTMEWQDGVLDPNSIKAQAANSNDFFLKDLYEIASSEEMVELIFSYENVYWRNGYLEIEDWEKPTDDNFDKSLTQDERKRFISMNIPLGFHIQGNLGQSLFPIFSPLSGKRSLNGNIQVIINSKGSLNHRTVGLAHEFGHVILYLNNRPYGHTQPGVDEFVGVRSTTMSKRLGYDW